MQSSGSQGAKAFGSQGAKAFVLKPGNGNPRLTVTGRNSSNPQHRSANHDDGSDDNNNDEEEDDDDDDDEDGWVGVSLNSKKSHLETHSRLTSSSAPSLKRSRFGSTGSGKGSVVQGSKVLTAPPPSPPLSLLNSCCSYSAFFSP
jgi:hypothetical protein